MLWLCNSFPSSIWVWLHWAKVQRIHRLRYEEGLWCKFWEEVLGATESTVILTQVAAGVLKSLKSFTKSAKSSTNLSPNHHISQEEAQPISVLQEENQQLRQQLQVDTVVCRAWRVHMVQSAASHRFLCTIRALSPRVETRQTTSKDTPTNTTETRTQMGKTNDCKATYKLTFCTPCFVPGK